MKKRNSVRISYDILKFCEDEYKIKTHIVYGTNINFNIMGKYLDWLVSEGMLECADDGKIFKTTDYGKRAIITFEQNIRLFNALDVR